MNLVTALVLAARGLIAIFAALTWATIGLVTVVVCSLVGAVLFFWVIMVGGVILIGTIIGSAISSGHFP